MFGKLKRNDYLIIALLGVLLLLVAIPTSSKPNKESVSYNNVDTSSDEARLKNTLEQIEGVGRTAVMITRDREDKVQGVLIVTEGANNPQIKERISEATSALFGIDLHKIIIVKMSAWEVEN